MRHLDVIVSSHLMAMGEFSCTVVCVCMRACVSHIEKQIVLQSLMVIVILKFKMFNHFSLNFKKFHQKY